MEENDICGATTRDGDPCQRSAGWGTDHTDGRCKQHGGKDRDKGGGPTGEANGAYEHGGFSQKIDDDEIIEAFVEAADTRNLNPVWLRLAGEAYARYKRSGNASHLSECRKCLENASEDGDDAVELGDIEVVADVT